MNRIILSLFLLLLIALAFTQPGNNRGTYLNEYMEADNFYHKSIDLSSFPGYTSKISEREIIMRRQALAGLKRIIPEMEKMHDDSLAFYCYYKMGVLEHSFDSLVNAKKYYEKAIAMKPSLPADSLLFHPFLFLGIIQYKTGQFDEALISYKKAETIASKHTTDSYKLDQSLGTMYYEMTNYGRAVNYFQKAMAVANKPLSSPDSSWTNYQLQLAASLMKLEHWNEAGKMYNELLRQDTNKNNLLHQAGIVNLRLGNANEALGLFNQVNYTDRNQVRLLNDIGQAYESMGHPDSARRYYLDAIKENNRWPERKNEQAGLTLKYLGDFDTRIKSFNEALKKYQKALVQLAPGFNDLDIYKNPDLYTSTVSYIPLFDVLMAKANAFEKFYHRVSDNRKLEAALQAYRAAFRLIDYVGKTFNGDDARLFLEKIRNTVTRQPIELCLLLYEQTAQQEYLEEAYWFDQWNKVTSLPTASTSDTDSVSNSLTKESSLRTAISRLAGKAAECDDSITALILPSIKDTEIVLREIQDELEQNPEYITTHLVDQIPTLAEVQQKLDRNTAIVSYNLSGNELLCFIITRYRFDFVRLPVATGFAATVDSFKNSLSDITTGPGKALSIGLYNTLILPVRSSLAKTGRLMIIPGDKLDNLPFEALRSRSGQYLIENFAVQYQYSTALFNEVMSADQAENADSSQLTLAYEGQLTKSARMSQQDCVGCTGITSLWKVDNPASAFVTQQLDYYIKKGFSKDKALQKAKIDLLNNADIDRRYKAPAYWAHLIFIGQYEPLPTLSIWWPLGGSVAVSFIIILLANLDSRRKRLRIQDLY
jgi:tetratricopeptide (TPR) repeat protein